MTFKIIISQDSSQIWMCFFEFLKRLYFPEFLSKHQETIEGFRDTELKEFAIIELYFLLLDFIVTHTIPVGYEDIANLYLFIIFSPFDFIPSSFVQVVNHKFSYNFNSCYSRSN